VDGECSYERPTRGTVSGTMRSMCGADAGCLAINYQFLLGSTTPCVRQYGLFSREGPFSKGDARFIGRIMVSPVQLWICTRLSPISRGLVPENLRFHPSNRGLVPGYIRYTPGGEDTPVSFVSQLEHLINPSVSFVERSLGMTWIPRVWELCGSLWMCTVRCLRRLFGNEIPLSNRSGSRVADEACTLHPEP